MDVGVRELKEHLSEYLDRVERGETIRVTDRGRPKILLTPLPGRGQLEVGFEQGWARPAKPEGSLRPTERARSQQRVLDVLGDDRDA